jgi:uncharacterized surface protein with fasciclin (FAS1) repeats
MRKTPFALALLLAGCVAPSVPVAPPAVVLAPEQRTLAQEIAVQPGLSTYAGLLAAAGAGRLAAAGPVTVFVPDDAAFARLSPDVPGSLAAAENRAMLARLLAYDMVEGAITADDLRARVVAGGGRATLPTLAGETLTVTLTGTTPTLIDADGDRAYLGEQVVRSNGVIQVVNGVMAPTLR